MVNRYSPLISIKNRIGPAAPTQYAVLPKRYTLEGVSTMVTN